MELELNDKEIEFMKMLFKIADGILEYAGTIEVGWYVPFDKNDLYELKNKICVDD